jgi:hypothetical protein
MPGKVILRNERRGDDWRNLWAYLGPDGSLHIDGQDLGPGTEMVSGDGEYEWFRTIQAEHVPRLVEMLGGEAGTDVLDLLASRYLGVRYPHSVFRNLKRGWQNGPTKGSGGPEGPPSDRTTTARKVPIVAIGDDP